MSGFLLDTNVISELVKPSPAIKVTAWMRSVDETLLYLSVLTLGEIRKGFVSAPDPARRAKLEAWLAGDLELRFADRILPIDAAIADRWGHLAGKSRVAGTPFPVVDGLLAATALHHNLTLVTRNTRDISVTGVALFNPWNA